MRMLCVTVYFSPTGGAVSLGTQALVARPPVIPGECPRGNVVASAKQQGELRREGDFSPIFLTQRQQIKTPTNKKLCFLHEFVWE